MTPKLIIGLAFGTGGIAIGGYAVLNHMSGEEAVVTPNPGQLTGTGQELCTKPSYKATISSDENVIYYICDELASTLPSATDITSPQSIAIPYIDSTFTQKTTTTSPQTTPVKWTYKQGNKTTEIDIYWYQKTDSQKQDIFIMKSSVSNETTVGLTNPKEIKIAIKDIEELRKDQTILIKEAQTESKQIDGMICTDPKQAINSNYSHVEYYICKTVTESSSTGTGENTSQNTTPFTYDATFKTKTGSKHKISKWTSTDATKKPIFYWFKPTDTSDTQTKIFLLVMDGETHMSDSDAKSWILKIKQFVKEQTV